jgi:hypothetical protein
LDVDFPVRAGNLVTLIRRRLDEGGVVVNARAAGWLAWFVLSSTAARRDDAVLL